MVFLVERGWCEVLFNINPLFAALQKSLRSTFPSSPIFILTSRIRSLDQCPASHHIVQHFHSLLVECQHRRHMERRRSVSGWGLLTNFSSSWFMQMIHPRHPKTLTSNPNDLANHSAAAAFDLNSARFPARLAQRGEGNVFTEPGSCFAALCAALAPSHVPRTGESPCPCLAWPGNAQQTLANGPSHQQ